MHATRLDLKNWRKAVIYWKLYLVLFPSREKPWERGVDSSLIARYNPWQN